MFSPRAFLLSVFACVLLLSVQSVHANPICRLLITEAVIAKILATDHELQSNDIVLKWSKRGEERIAEVFVQNVEVGSFDFTVFNETLAFNIFLDRDKEPNYQDRGLYGFLFDRILKLHPEVVRVPSTMSYDDSDNASYFYNKLLGAVEILDRYGRDFFEVGYIERLTKEERASLRMKILETFAEMPAYKVRDRSGYSDIHTIALYTTESGQWMVSFNVKKGKYRPLKTKIAIQSEDLLNHSIHPDGETEIIPRSEIIFPDYELIRPDTVEPPR